MLGAIAGDIIGSIYERDNIKTKAFPLFQDHCSYTDDTVCTLAVAHALLEEKEFAATLRDFARRYPGRGYGARFLDWARSDSPRGNGSWGNGAVMRVSPVGYVARNEDEVLDLAARSAAASHDHPDAVAAAQAAALTIWLTRNGMAPGALRAEIAGRFGYNLSLSVDQIRPSHDYDFSARGTLPVALICALEGRDYEDAVRNAISLGGDSDTLACIAGSFAEVLYGLPEQIAQKALEHLDDEQRALVARFSAKHQVSSGGRPESAG
ncbi:MAG: ADP-ribosylglycohydrolase family protein [Pseudomonadota bacterium]